jgi:hypothetical protein
MFPQQLDSPLGQFVLLRHDALGDELHPPTCGEQCERLPTGQRQEANLVCCHLLAEFPLISRNRNG